MTKACKVLFLFFAMSFTGFCAAKAEPVPAPVKTLRLVVPADQSPQERAIAGMLQQEITQRSAIRCQITLHIDAGTSAPTVLLAPRTRVEALLNAAQRVLWREKMAELHPTAAAEGFSLIVLRGNIWVIAANDAPGELFGAGWLLRHLVYTADRVMFPPLAAFFAAPEKPVRGYQVGYRMKNNTYDAWTLAQFEQQMRDMAVFGMNTVQVIAPISDDDKVSPLFHAPAIDVVVGLSRLSAKYGLRYDLYYPEMAKSHADPAQVAAELVQFEALVKQLPLVDSLHVPGGDPGHTAPELLLPLLEKEAAILHRYHPRAQIWVSAQGFDNKRFERFYELMAARPAWLTGIFFGPQTRESLPLERQRIPATYPLEFYPDIGHTMHAQFPVPDWDPVFALTEGREPICPRPLAFAEIYRHFAQWNTGFMLYSEGVNDDVNKVLWASLGWKTDEPVHYILQQYARYLLSLDEAQTSRAADAILGLEKNWGKPLLDPESSISQTHELFASLPENGNWRWSSLLYRDAYDRYLQLKRARELAAERQALNALPGNEPAAARAVQARRYLAATTAGTEEIALHQRLFSLADILFRDVGLQLSVAKYGASNWERGANLDRVDTPLNDASWIEEGLTKALQAPTEPQRVKLLLALADWTQPAPGTLYDDLGDPVREPHLVRGEAWQDDPEMYRRAIDGIADRTLEHGWRLSWLSYAETLYETPLTLRYTSLRTGTAYKLRITYAGEDYALPMQLSANGNTVLQPMRVRRSNPEQVEYTLPPSLTATGALTLQWKRPDGAGGGGRGGQVAEVWLIPEAQ